MNLSTKLLLVGGGVLGLALFSSEANAAPPPPPAAPPPSPLRRPRGPGGRPVPTPNQPRTATADELLHVMSLQVGKPYVLGVRVDKTDPNPAAFDCAEAVSWAVYQVTGKLYGVSPNATDPTKAGSFTGLWRADVASGRVRTLPVDVGIRTPGAILLRYPQPNSYGHIAVSTGDGHTYEAAGKTAGFIKGSALGRRWDTALAIPEIQLGAQRELVVPPSRQVWRLGSTGDVVRRLQEALGLTPDGQYGPRTVAAVTAFQKNRGLVPDGEAGPATLRALDLT